MSNITFNHEFAQEQLVLAALLSASAQLINAIAHLGTLEDPSTKLEDPGSLLYQLDCLDGFGDTVRNLILGKNQ